jgi:hypothetical protein
VSAPMRLACLLLVNKTCQMSREGDTRSQKLYISAFLIGRAVQCRARGIAGCDIALELEAWCLMMLFWWGGLVEWRVELSL